MLSSFLIFAQTTSPETTNPDAAAQPVRLSDAQMAAIGDQINGAAMFLGAILLVAVLCLGAIAFILAIGGR